MDKVKQTVEKLLDAVRLQNPLIHHITNYVTVNDCANITLAAGGSPIMADAAEEVEDIVSIASALVINIGTLNDRTVMSMLKAGRKANALHIPVVFDPVGAGASAYRSETAKMILKEIQLSVVRGNASEILFLAGYQAGAKGVDAAQTDLMRGLDQALAAAKFLARKQGCTTVVTGEKDIVTDGTQTLVLSNGHPQLGRLTGTGCMCTSLIASMAAVAENNMLPAAAAGITLMNTAGELAAAQSGGVANGSFHMDLIDEVSRMQSRKLSERMKVHALQS